MGSGKNFPHKNGTYSHINSNLGHLTEVVLVGFLYCKITPQAQYHNVLSRRKSLCVAHSWGVGVVLPSFRVEYLCNLHNLHNLELCTEFINFSNFKKVIFEMHTLLYLLIYWWLCLVFAAAHRLSLAAVWGSSLQWLLLLWSTGSRLSRLP